MIDRPLLPATTPLEDPAVRAAGAHGVEFDALGDRWCAVPPEDDSDVWTVHACRMSGLPYLGVTITPLHLLEGEARTLADLAVIAILDGEEDSAAPIAAVAHYLLAGRPLLAQRVSVGTYRQAVDSTPRWACYRDPHGQLVTGWQSVPVTRTTSWGEVERDDEIEVDWTLYGAVRTFVHLVGTLGVHAALRRARAREEWVEDLSAPSNDTLDVAAMA